jgi:DNA polymerase III delta prime subunit
LRWDAGWVAARAENQVEPSIVEELLAFRSHVAPSAAILDELPVFYRRAFTAQTNDTELIVGGADVIVHAKEGLERYATGHHGALLVTGAPGTGTTSAVRRILRELLEDRTRSEVTAPKVATCDVAAFDSAIITALRASDGTPVETALRSQPRGSVLVIHDLELWWHRGPDGLDVIRRLESFIEQYGSRILFVLTCSHTSAHLFRRLDLIEPMVVAHVPVEPMTAADAMDAVLRRHGTSELQIRFTDGHETTEFALARYFTTMREHTGGAAGPLLAAWLAHIEEVDTTTIAMRPVSASSLDAFANVPSDWIPVVVALAIHRRLDDGGLAHVLGTDATAIAKTLARSGLLTRRDGVTEIDRYMRPYVIRWLTEQGVLG